jgi:DNA-binding response OmpR family regulator
VVARHAPLVAAIVDALSDIDATFRAAYDGDAAIETAEEFDPDLVILGVRLLKRSGHLVLEQLKRNHDGREHKPFVIMVSDLKSERHRQWAKSLGADDWFQEPLQMDRLHRRVEELLRG